MARPPESDDALPPEVIRLSEAFEIYYRAVTPDVDGIEGRYFDELSRFDAPPSANEDVSVRAALRTASEAMDEARRSAELSFRRHLDDDGPSACVRDVKTGQILELKRGKWAQCQSFGYPGFDTDFVWEHDLVQPGPAGALIDGMLRPVFFDRSAFNHFIGKLSCKEDGIGIELLNRREPEADYNHLPENEPEQPQARLAWRALRAVYPERRISKSKSTATVTRRVNHWIENQPENIADRNSVSDSTVARVLGRKGR